MIDVKMVERELEMMFKGISFSKHIKDFSDQNLPVSFDITQRAVKSGKKPEIYHGVVNVSLGQSFEIVDVAWALNDFNRIHGECDECTLVFPTDSDLMIFYREFKAKPVKQPKENGAWVQATHFKKTNNKTKHW